MNPEAFEQLLKEHAAIAIHFWASWNGCDPVLDQSIQSIASEFAGRMSFYSCDVDREENADLCKRCRVVTIPWLAVFVSGTERRRIVGTRSPVELKNELEARFPEASLPKKWWRFWK
jgi:thioredoxin-like negative regulator of GroEL